jgi:membrane protease subunit HflC
MMLNKIEEQILNGIPTKKGSNDIGSQGLSKIALQKYGLKITNVGIRSLILPEEISKNVFDRMIAERKGIASNYRAEGKRQADTIRAEADSMKSQTIANAEAEAKIIKAEGDAEAAKHYAVFREDPALAIFLRKLDSLKKILGNKTTLVLDTDSAPFDLLKMNSDQLATPAKKVTPNKPKSKPGK